MKQFLLAFLCLCGAYAAPFASAPAAPAGALPVTAATLHGHGAKIAGQDDTNSNGTTARMLEPLPWEQTAARMNGASSIWTVPPAGVVSGTMTRRPLHSQNRRQRIP